MDKKEEERTYLDVFRELESDFPKGEINSSEEPDFLVVNNGCKLGIELCRVFRPQRGKYPQQAIESFYEEIMQQARQIAENAGTPPVRVDLIFPKDQPLQISPSEKLKFSGRIANFVHANTPQVNGYFQKQMPEYTGFAICINRNQHLCNHDWHLVHVDFAILDSRETLQIEIDKKSKKFKRYRKNCNKCWLLLIAKGRKASSFIYANDETRQHPFVSSFERTYFLHYADKTLIQLNTNQNRDNQAQHTLPLWRFSNNHPSPRHHLHQSLNQTLGT